MYESTTFLAQVWGPIMLVLGVSIFLNRSYYVSVYRKLESERLTLMITAIIAMAAGIAQVLYHNVWGTLPEIIISLLGWMMLVKGVVIALFPKVADKWGDQVASSTLLHIAGIAAAVLGGYLVMFAYL